MTRPHIDQILKEREETHGDFEMTADLAQSLKGRMQEALHANPPYTFAILEAVDMICTKLARIASGNAQEPDHWHDIAGYATLAARSLSKEQPSMMTKEFIMDRFTAVS